MHVLHEFIYLLPLHEACVYRWCSSQVFCCSLKGAAVAGQASHDLLIAQIHVQMCADYTVSNPYLCILFSMLIKAIFYFGINIVLVC